MKLFFKIVYIVLILFFILTVVLYFRNELRYYNSIDLGQVKLCVSDENRNLSYLAQNNGKLLIKPTNILNIWGNFPYIYGVFEKDDDTYSFFIDISKNNLELEFIEYEKFLYELEKRNLKEKEYNLYSFWDFRSSKNGKLKLKELRGKIKSKCSKP